VLEDNPGSPLDHLSVSLFIVVWSLARSIYIYSHSSRARERPAGTAEGARINTQHDHDLDRVVTTPSIFSLSPRSSRTYTSLTNTLKQLALIAEKVYLSARRVESTRKCSSLVGSDRIGVSHGEVKPKNCDICRTLIDWCILIFLTSMSTVTSTISFLILTACDHLFVLFFSHLAKN
jgi:hypothetical protein